MPRALDPTLAAGLPAGVIQPVYLVQLDLKSGTEYLWSGVGDLLFGSPAQTFKGVGDLGSVGPISEGADVKADGTFVTLSGIGLAQFPYATPGVTPPPSPVSPIPGGESLAWGYPTVAGASIEEGTGSASGTLYAGLVSIDAPDPPITTADRGDAAFEWSNFVLPPLPADAVIEAVCPTIVIGSYEVSESEFIGNGASFGLPEFDAAVTTYVGGPYTSPTELGADTWEGALLNLSAQIEIAYSGDGAVFTDGVSVSFIGVAVYYSSVSGVISNPTLIWEALNDIWPGGPAKIWFGLMQDGELLGTPYLVFSGTVDKPTVKVGVDSSSIELALENRLVNLQRASQRRYTAADQHIAFPDDLGFNWQEILQDIALIWG